MTIEIFEALVMQAGPREPEQDPPLEDPNPGGFEDPDYPDDPGPAEDPARQPVRA